ncbi:stage III sporulation protein AD [Ornithinibacillus sp. 4-3]|uniref:Stage III sporulation protein AD n=1 Tax=Ornithinibacillus sp. 4-3 TaxID=3231488 RepID=A0AB39HM54_9BACI
MPILQLVLIVFITIILFLLLKEINNSFAFFTVLVSMIFIFLMIINHIGAVFQLLTSLGNRAMIDDVYLNTILKIIGIAYVVEFSANMTKDVGLTALASKIELAGKISILLLAIPIITAVIEALLNFLPAT